MSEGIRCEMEYSRRYGSESSRVHEVLVRTPTPDLTHLQHTFQNYTIYPGHEPRLTEAEWREQQRPQAEVIERARGQCKWLLSWAAESADDERDCRATPARIMAVADAIDDLLAAVEAEPDFCTCEEKFWDPGCCADLPPGEDSSTQPYIEGGWAVEDPECPYDDPEEMEHLFLAPGCVCPRCHKVLPYKEEAAPQDARTPLPPEVIAKADDALKYNHENVGLNALRAIRPYLRAVEVMTESEHAEVLREELLAAQARAGDDACVALGVVYGDKFQATVISDESSKRTSGPYALPVEAVAALNKELAAAAEPKPCPHESAEWRDESWVWGIGCPPQHRYRPGDTCPDCGKPLPLAPQKPVEDMSAEECEAELKAAPFPILWHLIDGTMQQYWEVLGVIDEKRVIHVRGYTDKFLALRQSVRRLREHQDCRTTTDA